MREMQIHKPTTPGPAKTKPDRWIRTRFWSAAVTCRFDNTRPIDDVGLHRVRGCATGGKAADDCRTPKRSRAALAAIAGLGRSLAGSGLSLTGSEGGFCER